MAAPHACLTFITDRLVLRPLVYADLDRVSELFAVPTVARELGLDARTLMAAKDRLRRCEAHWDRYGYGPSGLVERSTGVFVGLAGLVRNEERDELGIEFSITPDRRGRGYATEALRAWIAWAASRRLADHLVTTVPEHHTAMPQTLERLGFVADPDPVLDGAAERGRVRWCLDLSLVGS
ncbi:Protein N-acetyltransferase, RimJ/RimL family [Raineyella antarctica]|uniref:Protein N-acetyltransferase, RimJ/RimL family n=1 Tax=Raineyella antarctica TaxID=1577474 RepID=A0A1G6GEH7_9ACTN|nr:GNAT family N-acetyltransferase [Raineyella antarctica]SDB80380.1 Protein N-acetyltransferase, RimJ/RimL family [Raineyella antarctica]